MLHLALSQNYYKWSWCQTHNQKTLSSNLIRMPESNTRDGLWPGNPGQRPSLVCFCSLRNHTRVVLYLSYTTKTTEKLLLIPEFHTPSSPWRHDDVTLTEPWHHFDLSNNAHHWGRHWGSLTTLTQQRKSVLHICCIWYIIFLYHARLNRQTPWVKFC
jgi:hypothetical protein